MAVLPPSTIVTINVTKQEAIKSLEDFGLACVLTEDATIPQGEYRQYDSVEAFDDDFSTSSSIKSYGDIFFAQSPTPTSLLVARVDLTEPETYSDVIERVHAQQPFYMLGVDDLDLTSTVVQAIATTVEDLKIQWIQQRAVADALSLYNILKAANFTRTSIIAADDDNSANRLDAAWIGTGITYTAGTINWANKSLIGVTGINQTNSVVEALLNAGVNCYVQVGNNTVTLYGTTAANDTTYIDQIQAEDWIRIGLQEDILGLIFSVPKIPYNDIGAQQIASVMRARGQLGQQLNVLDPTVRWVVTVPKVSTATTEQRESRTLPAFTISGKLSGAVNHIIGNVNVEI